MPARATLTRVIGWLGTLRRWHETHVSVSDGALATTLAALAMTELVAAGSRVEGPVAGQALAFLGMTGAVALRRRAVVLAAAACGTALVVQELLGPAPVVAGFLALLIVTYSAAAHGTRETGLGALALILAALTVHPVTDRAAREPADLVGNLAIFVGAWGVGRLVAHHRARERALAEAHAQLRQSQELERVAALAGERARIARELHDIVAHAVSLMVLQCGAARAVLDTRPDVAREALLAGESSGRAALEDLHRMLNLLRWQGDDPPRHLDGDSSPAPDVQRLPALIEEVERSGLVVRFTRNGEPPRLGPGISQAAYRIVQEALTNVLKHSGSREVDVTVTYGPRALSLEVRDSGGAPSAAAVLPSGGMGLLGLRERVDLYGGRLSAGPHGDGWRVEARLPYESTAVASEALS